MRSVGVQTNKKFHYIRTRSLRPLSSFTRRWKLVGKKWVVVCLLCVEGSVLCLECAMRNIAESNTFGEVCHNVLCNINMCLMCTERVWVCECVCVGVCSVLVNTNQVIRKFFGKLIHRWDGECYEMNVQWVISRAAQNQIIFPRISPDSGQEK